MSHSAPDAEGPLQRTLSLVGYPLILCVTVGGAVIGMQAQVGTVLVVTTSFFFVIGSCLLLEWLLPYDERPDTKPRATVELVNSAINLVANSRLFRPLLALGVMKLSVALTGRSGLLPSEWFGPWWLQGILAFLLTDLGRYLVHRAQHRVPALWTLHKVHHSVQKVRTFNLQFSHPLDYLLRNVVTFYVPVLLGFSEEGIVLGVVLQYATGIPSHCNARLRFGPLNYVIGTSRVHRWHHSIDTEDGGDANFGAGLVLWDHVFGSFHLPRERRAPETLGVEEGPPRSLAATLLWPLSGGPQQP